LPAWSSVLVPLAYTGSILALTLATGQTDSGVGIVILVPVVWTALFHRRWESVCVVGAVVIVELVTALVPVPLLYSIIVRRLFFWAILGAVISVAIHRLRESAARSRGESIRLHEELERIAVVDERERVARDLHDTVIQRLFAVGLSLEDLSQNTADRVMLRKLETAAMGVEDSIRLLRTTIYGLNTFNNEHGIRAGVLSLLDELNEVVGFEVTATFDGPVDSAIPDEIGDQLPSILREAITNISRHADATAASVALSLDGECLILVVRDNGRGIVDGDVRAGALGLLNMRQRAEGLLGQFSIECPDTGGTVLTWRVPVAARTI
jgi:signal transduction histidine kinase